MPPRSRGGAAPGCATLALLAFFQLACGARLRAAPAPAPVQASSPVAAEAPAPSPVEVEVPSGKGRVEGPYRVAQASANEQLDNFEGVYRIRQKKQVRYLDAYESLVDDSRPGLEVITRPLAAAGTKDAVDRTQVWVVTAEGGDAYSVMQASSGRFLDALTGHTKSWKTSWSCICRPARSEETYLGQKWFIQRNPAVTSQLEVRLMQASSMRFLDAYLKKGFDFQAMTEQEKFIVGPNGTYIDDAQYWVLERVQKRQKALEPGKYVVQQKATGRQLDARSQDKPGPTTVTTREIEFSETQHFIFRRLLGMVYSITQESSGRLLGAKPNQSPDQNGTVMTRGLTKDSAQRWMLVRQGYDEFVLIHIASGRVLDAYVNPDAAMASKHGADYRAYSARQTLAGVDGNVSSQVWRIRHIAVAPAMDGIYRLSSLGRSLEQGTSEMPGAFAAATSDDTPGQLWELKRLEGETYQIAKSGPTPTYLSALIGPTFAASINIAAEWGFCSAMVPGVDSPSTYWYAKHVQGDRFKFRQQETGRFLSSIIAANTEPAVVSKGMTPKSAISTYQPDQALVNRVVTEEESLSPNQAWDVVKVGERCPVKLPYCPAFYECGTMDNWCSETLTCGLGPGGACLGKNAITGETHKCTFDHTCVCSPKTQCAGSCGQEDDGCGGFVVCGLHGRCPQVNLVTGERHRCEMAAAALAVPAPAPAPAPAPSTTCTCAPRVCQTGLGCTMEDDGCGGQVCCTAAPPAPAPLAAPALAPAPAPTVLAPMPAPAPPAAPAVPVCAPKETCDAGAECGFQPDGCGAMVKCGAIGGGYCSVAPMLTCSAQHRCVCEPRTCAGRCGSIPDGCGGTLTCGCGVGEFCAVGKSVCVQMPYLPVQAPGPAPAMMVVGLPVEELHMRPILAKVDGAMVTEMEWDADTSQSIRVDILTPLGMTEEVQVPITSEILNRRLPAWDHTMFPMAAPGPAAPGPSAPGPAAPVAAVSVVAAPPPAVAKPGIHDVSLEPVFAKLREKFPGALVTELKLETDKVQRMLDHVKFNLLTAEGLTWQVSFSPNGEILHMVLDTDSEQPTLTVGEVYAKAPAPPKLEPLTPGNELGQQLWNDLVHKQGLQDLVPLDPVQLPVLAPADIPAGPPTPMQPAPSSTDADPKLGNRLWKRLMTRKTQDDFDLGHHGKPQAAAVAPGPSAVMAL